MGLQKSELAGTGLDGESPQPVTGFFDGDDRTRGQGIVAFTEHPQKPRDHRARRLVLEPHKNDAGEGMGSKGQQVGKVEIAGDDKALLPSGLFKDERIGQALKTFFAQMPDVMTALTKGLDRAERQAHIGQTLHNGLTGRG